jgi:hypothetical protein
LYFKTKVISLKLRIVGIFFSLVLGSFLFIGCPNKNIGPAGFKPTNTPTPTQTNIVAYTPSFTPTSTPGPVTFTFDGINVVPAGWVSVVNSGIITVPALMLSSAQNEESSCASECYSLWAGPITFSATGQSADIQYDYSSPGLNWTGKTISLYYYLDALPSNIPYGEMYVQDTNYDFASLGFGGGSYALTAGAWTKVSIPANQGGVDSAKILDFGAQIGTGNSSGANTFNTVNYYIDYVTVQ